MRQVSVSFKNCQYSKALEESVESYFEDAMTVAGRLKLATAHVTISEENGVYTPGPDVFKCVLVATFADGKTVRLSVEGRSPYESVDRLFGMFRRTLVERKRRRIHERNDARRMVLRARAAGFR
jgi:ribosome-associated translation inhibitor RaiA